MSFSKIPLFLLCTAEIDDPRNHKEWENKLPAGRWKKSIQFLNEQDRKNSAGAGALLCYLFEQEGIPLKKDAIYYGKYGKPYHEKLFFNLSHSGDYVIGVSGKQEIGCDIQQIKPYKTAMIKKFFSLEEQQYLLSVEEEERQERFISLWSRKESYLKMTGEGLTRDLSKVSCLDASDFYEKKIGEYLITICEKQEKFWKNEKKVEFRQVNSRELFL